MIIDIFLVFIVHVFIFIYKFYKKDIMYTCSNDIILAYVLFPNWSTKQ